MASKWEDTVMKIEKFAEVTGLSPDAFYMYEAALPELEAQAEITWHARDGEIEEAEKRGAKKVVGFVQNGGYLMGDKWQAFLKDLGIEVKENGD